MKRIILLLAGTAIIISLNAQVPQGFNYQAVARDNEGKAIADTDLTIRIGILAASEVVWQEDHLVQTSSTGLFSLIIGGETASKTGGSAETFEGIPWGEGGLEIEVSVDAGGGFATLGTSPLASVPYALYSQNGPRGEQGPPGDPATDDQELLLTGTVLSISGGNEVDLSPITGGSQVWSLSQDTIYTTSSVAIGTNLPNNSLLAIQSADPQTEKPLFEVRNDLGNPVFAVYNDGVMVYVDENKKGVKGGFAVGGYNSATKGVSQEYLRISPDSVRIYVPESDVAKGIKGGFAVGGYNAATKAPSREYLRITPDSVRIYVPEGENAKGQKGGFAVGGYNTSTKGTTQDLLYVTPDSIRLYVPDKENDPGYVGLQGGFAVETFKPGISEPLPREYIMGVNRGITRFNTSDNRQGFAIGSQGEGWGSSYLQLTPVNTFVGFESGVSTRNDPQAWDASQGSMNVFLGYKAGQANRYGHHNVFMGYQAGLTIVGDSLNEFSNSYNILIGPNAGRNLEFSYSNIMMGQGAGLNMAFGEGNIFLGESAAGQATEAYNNIAIGQFAGGNLGGYNNVMIGNRAGESNSSGSSNVFIGNNTGSGNFGSGNVFIGSSAGSTEEGSNLLYIENSGSASPLIRGDFQNDLLRFNAEVAINTVPGSSYRLDVLETRTNYSYAAIHGANYSTPNYGIGVEGRGGYSGLIGYAYESGSGYRMGVYGYGGNGQYNYGVYGYAYGGSSYAIYAAGNVTYTGSLVSASDAKFKENIQPLGSVIGDLMKVMPRSYRIADNPQAKSAGISSTSQYGLVAQEIETIFPDLVVEVVQPKQPDENSGDSKDSGEPDTFKGVKYMELIPILIKGMQEQQEEIEYLKLKIANLEQLVNP